MLQKLVVGHNCVQMGQFYKGGQGEAKYTGAGAARQALKDKKGIFNYHVFITTSIYF
jgi:hypothetical protein